MSVRKFAFHDNVKSTPPVCIMADLHAKCVNDVKSLTTKEKQYITDNTRSYEGKYRLAGWEFDFREFMCRFVVRYRDESKWSTQYAFNKTNIRKNIYLKTGIMEIYEVPNMYKRG